MPDVLQKNFKAEAPNKKWVSDITEFNVKGQKLYLSASISTMAKSSPIAAQEGRCSDLVTETLKGALDQLRERCGLILHSDQGWQYKMLPYRKLLVKHGLTQSMSRKGNCFDNAAIESFFGTLKAEFLRLTKIESIGQLEIGLRDYIHYYNNERIKLRLNGMSPVEYRLQTAATSSTT